MDIAFARRLLDDPEAAAEWLRGLGVVDMRRGHANLQQFGASRITLDLVATAFAQVAQHLGSSADPDMGLNNLARFVAASRSPLSLVSLFERDPQALSTLLQIFTTSQYLSDLLVNDPESFDLLRLTEGRPVGRRYLVEELVAEIEALEHDDAVLRALRRFKHRETLRIAYGDIIREQPVRKVATQISYVAEAILEAALKSAWRKLLPDRGMPRGPDGQPARLVVIGMGKLGGAELNYSSDIDLILLYDTDGKTDGRRQLTNQEFFDRLAREFVRLLTETTGEGCAYRVDLRLRPEGKYAPMVISTEAALQYYDIRGRTWERQAYIKARPVAGALDLGREYLDRLRPWVFRWYLSRGDIGEIKALKRRIEWRTQREGGDYRNVKTGRGGIRDVEFVIQFLQLLNGGTMPHLQSGNTLEAIAALGSVGALRGQERTLLEKNYSFLRKIEHRLQIMFDLQTHLLPETPEEMRKLAIRTGYTDDQQQDALGAFEADYREATTVNRRILDHLLNQAFRDDDQAQAEVDLVLDPEPSDTQIQDVLGRYRFRNATLAYRNLMSLAEEDIRFLSTPRCRHFLAAIAPDLLSAIAATPDPDSTLVNLDKVSSSLGGKGVLWELFSFNPPSLRLYVDLCAYSPYLCGILTSNPGMADGLMDSLVLNRLPSRKSLARNLADLCRGAEDLDPIFHSFKNDQQLRVGVRDLLGKEDVCAITRTLSDLAEVCLAQIAQYEYERLVKKFGTPMIDQGPRKGETCDMAIVAMGKLGGQEMNYHSDLDIVFLFEAEGHTRKSQSASRFEGTSNQHFFGELGQRIIKRANHLTPYGKLYEVDARLRPTGKSGPLATSLQEFDRYFSEGSGQLWERQALCKARVAYGSRSITETVLNAVAKAAFGKRWRRSNIEEIRKMRARMEDTAAPGDLKRGPGGIVDIEFLVQMLQLKHGRRRPKLRQPNTIEALDQLHHAGCLETEDYEFFTAAYRTLRTVEGRLRLMNATARDTLPDDSVELAKLAQVLHYPSGQALLKRCRQITEQTRQRFEQIFQREGG